jgi:hypothetical protein
MTEWFFVSAWYEKAETEIHFEIANEDGEQYFFSISSELVNQKLPQNGSDALDRFYYAEEDMLSLAVSIIDNEMLDPECQFVISAGLAIKHFL